jgi:hypothetical protein
MSNQKTTITVEEILGEHINGFTAWVTKYPESREAKDADAEGAGPRGELPFFAKYLKRFLRRTDVSLQLGEATGLSADDAAMLLAGSIFLHGNEERRKHLGCCFPPHSNN